MSILPMIAEHIGLSLLFFGPDEPLFLIQEIKLKESQKSMNLLAEVLKFILVIHAVFLGLILVVCFLYNFINPPFGTLQLYRKYQNNYPIKSVQFVPLRQIPKPIKTMVVDIEDGTFYQHHGIDFNAIHEAIEINKRMKRRFYGGSTITQQLSRTLFLYPDKTFFRKYLEALIALEMDLVVSKNRILELYLNSIEWGRGIFGIERASWVYFNKSVRDLDKEEMIRLITILPSPVKYGPDNFENLRIMRERYDTLKAIMGMAPTNAAGTYYGGHSVFTNSTVRQDKPADLDYDYDSDNSGSTNTSTGIPSTNQAAPAPAGTASL